MNMKWEYLREEEFEGAIERSGGLCVMTLGCLEKHGQHLPVGTDSLKGDRIDLHLFKKQQRLRGCDPRDQGDAMISYLRKKERIAYP